MTNLLQLTTCCKSISKGTESFARLILTAFMIKGTHNRGRFLPSLRTTCIPSTQTLTLLLRAVPLETQRPKVGQNRRTSGTIRVYGRTFLNKVKIDTVCTLAQRQKRRSRKVMTRPGGPQLTAFLKSSPYMNMTRLHRNLTMVSHSYHAIQ